jgi:hypothetical protein
MNSHTDCSVNYCGDDTTQAARDFNALVVGYSVDTGLVANATPEEQATQEAFESNYRGGWLSSNAQALIPPYYDQATGSVLFTAAAPHLKHNGDPNRGFFRAFIPDSFVTNVWGVADPTTLNVVGTRQEEGTVIADVVPTVVHTDNGAEVNGQAVPGLLVLLEDFSYSAPRFKLFPDQDEDGVADAKDGCPTKKGDAGNDGCPGHGRTLTLKITKALAKMKMGGVLQVKDSFNACRSGIKIKVQRKVGTRWTLFSALSTSSKGLYSTTTKAKKGTYRATVAGQRKSGGWCDSVKSSIVRFSI